MGIREATFTAVSLDQLAELRQFIEQAATELGCDSDTSADMIVAANEAITNVIVHGYQETVGDITLRITYIQPILQLDLIDQAPAYDPTATPSPDLTTQPHLRSPGGLGVHMMREFTDSLRYSRLNNSQNQLTLTKGVIDEH